MSLRDTLRDIRSRREKEITKHERILARLEVPNRVEELMSQEASLNHVVAHSLSQEALNKWKEEELSRLRTLLLLDSPVPLDTISIGRAYVKSYIEQGEGYTALSEIISLWMRAKGDEELARRKSFITFLRKNGLLIEWANISEIKRKVPVEDFESLHNLEEIDTYLKSFKGSQKGKKHYQYFKNLVRFIRDFLALPNDFRSSLDLLVTSLADFFTTLEQQIMASAGQRSLLGYTRDLLLIRLIFIAPSSCKINSILTADVSCFKPRGRRLYIDKVPIPISEDYRELLSEYLGLRKKGYLFSVDHNGINPVDQNAFNRKLKALCKRCRLGDMSMSSFQGSFYTVLTGLKPR